MNRRAFTIYIVASNLLGGSRAAEPPRSGRTHRIGVLVAGGTQTPGIAVFVEGLREHGYVEGQNVVIERRYAEGHLERLPDLAAAFLAKANVGNGS